MRKYIIISINCDCASGIMARIPKAWVYGPRCQYCRKILGPMQYDILDEIKAKGDVHALRLYREKMKKMKTFFISGHRNITPAEFNEYYIPAIDKALENEYYQFVIGDYYGVDILAQQYLFEKGIKKVTVYHMLVEARNNAGFPTKGGFRTDEDRDSRMTMESDEDIAWVRPGNDKSGTAINLRRRKK